MLPRELGLPLTGPTTMTGAVCRLEAYKATVARLFPSLPREYLDNWSVSRVDALALVNFIECCPGKVFILEIGTFVGVSTFLFASQPKVISVTSIDPNPTIADEINDKSEVLGTSVDPGPLQNLRVLDVAQVALAKFSEEKRKIQLLIGSVGSRDVGIQRGSSKQTERIEVPLIDPSRNVSLVAFVDGLHTKEGVQADLKAIFEKNPHAVIILDDCRGPWERFVQAGIASFMEEVQGEYHFRLFEDLNPTRAASNLGLVYPDIGAAEVEKTLEN